MASFCIYIYSGWGRARARLDGMYRWHGANTNNDDENNQDVDSRSHISSSHASCMMGIMRYTQLGL